MSNNGTSGRRREEIGKIGEETVKQIGPTLFQRKKMGSAA